MMLINPPPKLCVLPISPNRSEPLARDNHEFAIRSTLKFEVGDRRDRLGQRYDAADLGLQMSRRGQLRNLGQNFWCLGADDQLVALRETAAKHRGKRRLGADDETVAV